MDEIDKNIQAFERVQNELEKEHMGKWVLFHNEKLIGLYGDFEEAANHATKKFGSGPYLIRQIGVSSFVPPVSVVVKK